MSMLSCFLVQNQVSFFENGSQLFGDLAPLLSPDASMRDSPLRSRTGNGSFRKNGRLIKTNKKDSENGQTGVSSKKMSSSLDVK